MLRLGKQKCCFSYRSLSFFHGHQRFYKSSFGPLFFAGGVAGVSFLVASILDYEKRKKMYENRGSIRGIFNNLKSSFNTSRSSTPSILQDVKDVFNRMTAGDKTAWTIIVANTAVFLLWQFPSMQSTMLKHFTSTINSPSYTLLTSVFSHNAPIHLFFNMMAVHSFVPMLVDQVMGVEQFTAMYLTSGVVSALGSRIVRAMIGYNTYSLGASGALFGLLGFLSHSSTMQVSVFFFGPFPLSNVFWASMAFDAFSLVFRNSLGWDHAAHLAGGMFGVLYFRVLKPMVWDRRMEMLEKIGYKGYKNK
ncbi:Peptidase S54, rhomboid domain-containing protein [Rozella allomycis CSF55]|uniref:Peptidase S54, rhomboid domain-containing protein n=1 Tax=Rozella allomycis (strain CSF55) TaxID=988480 RepID=A0A075B0P7_ROZAC|nr:Peptidase S54, rhomboid domain-containing protein [Rozella allomycis CSF55]|eukprot:EPZ36109.1 Peptidase S54, rhomboid domain-containing protein [Rozella allomycis CSF55]